MLSHLYHLFTPHHTNNHKPKVLHPTSLVILLSLFITSQALISLTQLIYPQILGYASQIPPTTVIDLTNQKRAEAGLSPLKYNPKLADAARRKASDMFIKNYWAHNSPDGTKPWAFVLAAGYNYLHAGENLARDFNNPNTVVDAWMASPTHRENLLNARFTEIGIAVVDGQFDGVETTLVVQMFGTPQSTSPALTQGDNTSVIPAAQAQEPPVPTPTPTPKENLPTQQASLVQPVFSTFTLSKIISLLFLILIFTVLLIDWFIAWDRNLIRLSGHNWAHLAFLGVIIALSLIIKQGLIL